MVTFDEPSHTYSNSEGEQYISVTTLIKKYSTPFDSTYWSQYKALKDVLEARGEWKRYKLEAGGWENVVNYCRFLPSFPYGPQVKERIQYYLKLWKEGGEDAAERGRIFHKKAELRTKNSVIITETLREVDLVYKEMIIEKPDFNSVKVYAEQIVYSHKYRVAGQVDWIYKEGRDLYIKDYKTCREISTEAFMDQTLLGPLSHLADTKFNKFQLQLSIYACLLEMVGYNIKRLLVEHVLTDEDRKPIEIKYLREEAIKLLDEHLRDYRNERKRTAEQAGSLNHAPASEG